MRTAEPTLEFVQATLAKMTQKLDCPQSLKVSATPEYDDTRHNRAKDARKSPGFIQIIIIIVIIRWSSHINVFNLN